jgi:SDR family mycofactocin-dependent oxidoreductase
MPGAVTGKVALITGGARGHGRSHALALASVGADSAFLDIGSNVPGIGYDLANENDIDETRQLIERTGVRCMARPVDTRDRDVLGAFIDEVAASFSRVDILIANHGVVAVSPVETMTFDQWDAVIGINLTGVFNVTRFVLPHMRPQGWGRIVVTSSMAGKTGVPELADYAASKWGLIGFVKSLALETAKQGITVNAICPCMVNTPILHNSVMYGMFRPDLDAPTLDDVIEGFSAMQEQGIPWVEPEDITDTIMFLVSDGAKRITGETLSVASGQNARNAG